MPLSSSKSKVCLFFEFRDFTLKNRTSLKAFIERLFKQEKHKLYSLNIIFCSDKKLLEINRDYLKHDFYTDIITFDLSESSGIKGEIYISINRVRENAKQLGQTFTSELHRVIFHGVLHLCGYLDKSKSDQLLMREKENLALNQYFS